MRERRANHWGSVDTEFPFAGRKVTLARPRVRKDGKEVSLPAIERLRRLDPVCEKVIEQILLGVSTRGYGKSLERLPEAIVSRGTSKSAASRHIVVRTRARVAGDTPTFWGRCGRRTPPPVRRQHARSS